jgi:hypothetical protein
MVNVQGYPHELLTQGFMEGVWPIPHPMPAVTGSNADVDFSDIRLWAQEAVNESWPVDSAAMIVKWTDDKEVDNILLWGYRWNTFTVHDGDTALVAKYSMDMVRAIANADPRFIVLTQLTGSMGYTIDGMGYRYDDCSRVQIAFEYDSARIDPRIAFHYTPPPNTDMGQRYVPDDPAGDAARAIEIGYKTGIIEHPFNIVYGYPAYDYDWWRSTEDDRVSFNWQSGWYNGYWTFYTKDQPSGSYSYSGAGASSRILGNGYVDGWVYSTFLKQEDMSGDYVAPEPCSPSGTTAR